MSENETTGIKRPNFFASNVTVENIVEPKKKNAEKRRTDLLTKRIV